MFPYAQDEKLPAVEYNEVVKAAGLYAADAGASDAYAITVSPVPSSYITGMVFRFKANTISSGAATLNVNSLGAKSILRPDGSALADGDIAAGQFIEVIYNGTSFVMLSPISNAPKYTNGTTTKNISDANATQTIAHGLGRIPRRVKITTVRAPNWTNVLSYNGTIASVVYFESANGNRVGIGSTLIAYGGVNETEYLIGTVTFDATNISITWVKTGSPTGTLNILWEAEA